MLCKAGELEMNRTEATGFELQVKLSLWSSGNMEHRLVFIKISRCPSYPLCLQAFDRLAPPSDDASCQCRIISPTCQPSSPSPADLLPDNRIVVTKFLPLHKSEVLRFRSRPLHCFRTRAEHALILIACCTTWHRKSLHSWPSCHSCIPQAGTGDHAHEKGAIV